MASERFANDGKESNWKKFGKYALIAVAAIVGINVVVNALKR